MGDKPDNRRINVTTLERIMQDVLAGMWNLSRQVAADSKGGGTGNDGTGSNGEPARGSARVIPFRRGKNADTLP